MCGRAYSTFTDEELYFRYLNQKGKKNPIAKPNYNLSPTQTSIVVRREDDQLTFDLFRWGLIPFWAKDEKIGYKMINARSETLAEKPSFRNAFKSRRCLIPLSGFIEWKRDGESKRPFAIHLTDQASPARARRDINDKPIMSLAGLWENWKNSEGKDVKTFTLITTEANSFMEKIHDRMPVILDKEQEEIWLSESAAPKELQSLFKPCPSKWLAAYEISTLVNNPRNNRAELLDPLAK